MSNFLGSLQDRIAGGITYYPYQFDKKLIAEYKNLLGDWFLGFQMHESASNRRKAEWPRMIKAMGSKGPYNAEQMRRLLMSKSAVTPDGEYLVGLSHDTPEYYANRTYAETVPDFLAEVREMFQRRLNDTDNAILPVDSFYLFTKLQDELGMRTFMPEVGSQITMMRVAVALARGMAKASGKTWGTYYECWRVDLHEDGTETCNMPCFNLDPINEWYLTQETHGDDFTTHGPNGGSSRRLQDRIYYHTLMSGADYFGEEWGLNCSYTDMNEFTLSEYGQVKKNFIHTARGLQGVQPVIPFAIVLPKDYTCVEIPNCLEPYELGVHNGTYMNVTLTAEEKAYYSHVEDVIKLFFARIGERYGNEGHTLTNSRFGDVVDIIYEDAPMEALSRYEYLIDATSEGKFARENAGKGLKILESADLAKLEAEVRKLVEKTMPCYVDGLHWLVSTDNKGRRFLTIFNNEGNQRSSAMGDVILQQADRRVKITLNVPGEMKVFKNPMTDPAMVKAGDNTYYVTVPAADFLILEF